MSTTFIAISNMSGIACASDTDNTIYQLSRSFPFAVAVDSCSPIPWDAIINGYKRSGEPEEKEDFVDCVKDFEEFLSTIPASDNHPNLSIDHSKIIFMGYGKEDIFPRLYATCLRPTKGKWEFDVDKTDLFKVSHKDYAHIDYLGGLENVYTLIWGATGDVNDKLLETHIETFELYKERVLERFKGTEFEAFVTRKLDAYDAKQRLMMKMRQATDKTFANVLYGIEKFSVEDMVMAAETIVNAEVRLGHLSSGCKKPLSTTREIAVITRTEGLTWIKHSLYAL